VKTTKVNNVVDKCAMHAVEPHKQKNLDNRRKVTKPKEPS
jgi:hypothetical protein